MSLTLPALVQAVFDATNAGDSEAFVAAFTDDGVIDDWGREFAGHDGIRGWSDRENIGVQATWAPTELDTRDGEHVVTATVGGDGFNGPSHFTFHVTGDRVSRMTIRA